MPHGSCLAASLHVDDELAVLDAVVIDLNTGSKRRVGNIEEDAALVDKCRQRKIGRTVGQGTLDECGGIVKTVVIQVAEGSR